MSGTVNLSPGSTVPKTGKYKCEFCDEGRVADFFGLKGTGLDVGQSQGPVRQSNIRFFETGHNFTECPTCGPATGWTLIEEACETGMTTTQRHDEALSTDQKETRRNAEEWRDDNGRQSDPPEAGSTTLSAGDIGDEAAMPSAINLPPSPEDTQKKASGVSGLRLSKWSFIGIFVGAFLGLLVLAVVIPLVMKSFGETGLDFIFLIPLIMVIIIIVIKLKLVAKMWSAIQDGYARTTPKKAVGFLLIPLFNVYWIFQAFWGFARDYNAIVDRYSINASKLWAPLFTIYCILSIPLLLPPFLLPFKQIVGPLLLVWFVVSTIMIIKICDAVNAIPADKIEEIKAGKFMPDHQKDISQIQDNYDEPLFLYIPIARLILLSIASMGTYQAYWIYKNWRYIKERENLSIRPFWRGIFGLLFCHSLLRRIHEDMKSRSVQTPFFSPGGLATGFVALAITANLISRAPGVGAGITAFVPSFLCLVPVQRYINSVTEQRKPFQLYYGWSSGHIVCLVFGIIVWLLLLSGLGDRM